MDSARSIMEPIFMQCERMKSSYGGLNNSNREAILDLRNVYIHYGAIFVNHCVCETEREDRNVILGLWIIGWLIFSRLNQIQTDCSVV
jgi:hypothetical protein